MRLLLLLLFSFFLLNAFPATTVLSVYGSADPPLSIIRNHPDSSRTRFGKFFAAGPKISPHIPSPAHGSSRTGLHQYHYRRPPSIALAPSQAPALSPLTSFDRHHHIRKGLRKTSPAPSYLAPEHVLPSPSPSPSWGSPATHEQPAIFPLSKRKTPPPPPIRTLPPPPPNEECLSVTCSDPLTYTPLGSPCGCVRPIQIELHLNIAIYTFFPMVTELANEIASSIKLNYSQVRIMGANAANKQLEKSIVLINLVPQDGKFGYSTALSIYKKFWNGEVFIRSSLFGAYEVVYVLYPGLPPSPPSTSSSISSMINDIPHPGVENGGLAVKPLGVDVPRKNKTQVSRSILTVIILSSFTIFIIFLGVPILLLLNCRAGACRGEKNPLASPSSIQKPSGNHALGGVSVSYDTYTNKGSAKLFTVNDIERATNCFDTSRIIGEGGFGVVYKAVLDDGREVAVKVLKKENRHGSQEFLAEVEMLSRLHHRNLVKLIGICVECDTRCLVYELVPNGSVESHLHGADKESSPLDWRARMRIALGAARALAYLHEDSSPRVIHRDFKSSNILLEHDFTPKVSDFGLARTALEEGHKQISTHVMGTFGYLAPEYAMTGHLLVKSDVYSYGVVLLELLTGRKPVDLSQPPGQENLVGWTRPSLTSKEGLEAIIDQKVQSTISFDSIAKVAAIASMCVQPEVSHRPFMGEVVQALKLVCSELDEIKEASISVVDQKASRFPGEVVDVSSPIVSSRRRSSSGPLLRDRKEQFWQKLKYLSGGSKSEPRNPFTRLRFSGSI